MLAHLAVALLAVSMPEFDAVDVSGKTLGSAELAGEISVFNFWMIGCGPCVAEIDSLNPLVKRYPDVKFLGVSTDETDRVKRFISNKPFEYRQLPDGMELAAAFGVRGYPTHAVVNRTGRIVAWFLGGERIDAKLDAVIAWVKAGEKPADRPDVGGPPPDVAARKVSVYEQPPELRVLVARLKSENKTHVAKALLDQVKWARQQLTWSPDARIVIGQVQVEGGVDPRKVRGPAEILDDGWFAAMLPDSEARLVLDGYAPVYFFADDSEPSPWLGTLTLARLAPDQLARLDGRVVLPESELAKAKVTVRPWFPEPPRRCGAPAPTEPLFDPAVPVKLGPRGVFSVKGLSPSLHCLEVRAPGRLTWEGCLDLKGGAATTARPIEPERQRTVSLTIVERRGDGYRPEDVEQLTLRGAASWNTADRWLGPEPVSGVLLQSEGQLTLETACESHELGRGPIDRHANAQWQAGWMHERARVRDGAVYLVRCQGQREFLLAFAER